MPPRHPISPSTTAIAVSLITAGILASTASAAPDATAPAEAASPAGFTFAQICDTQLGMGGYEHDLGTFQLAVGQLNELAPDFVLVCGDLVNDADDKSFADFNRIKAGFRIPCHCAPGNHDIGMTPTAASLKRFREKIGRDYLAFVHKGHAFVIANSQLWKSNLAGESEKHDAWFRTALGKAKELEMPVVVITHYPLFVKAPDEAENYSNIAPAKRRELLDLFENHGVVAVLSGHTHRLVVNEHRGIRMVAGETTSNNFDDRPMGFRIWRARNGGVLTHEFVPLKGAPAPANPEASSP